MEEFRSDREVVLAAANKHGCALEFASDELRSDREVLLAAVNNDGRAFEFAIFDYTTNVGIAFVQAVLGNLQKQYEEHKFNVLLFWKLPPALKATLIRLRQKLKETDQNFSVCGDLAAVVFAQR